MPSASSLDAVTIDAMGTLIELPDPSERLQDALAKHRIDRELAAVAAALAAEAAYYVPRAHEGRDVESLAHLQRDAADVFLAHLDAHLDPAEFAPHFVAALEFRLLPGAEEAVRALRGAGLALACVTNWDVSLPTQLERLGVASYFAAVVTSAEAGAPKPEPRVFALALERLRIDPNRVLHIGDGEADREGAAAAGLAFEPTPLATLPERLGL
jgi:putative hydrolase of the HAD superfamily